MLDRDFLMAGFSGVAFSSAENQSTCKVVSRRSDKG